jgi:Fic family protein
MPLHFAIIKAIAAHLYMAWIHPFGDGNGRVARLLEFAMLLKSGVPAAAHLLSNHYNLTRTEYYRQLDRASKTNRPVEFISYAIRGFVDGLNEQLAFVEEHIVDVCWREYVYEQFRKVSNKTNRRRRELVLQVSGRTEPLSRDDMLLLMEKEYTERTGRTLSRDLNWLVRRGLLVRTKEGYRANKELMLQFMPFTANS